MERLTKRELDGGQAMPYDFLDCNCEEYCQLAKNCCDCTIQDCYNKLAKYEDAEENGEIIRKKDIKAVLDWIKSLNPYHYDDEYQNPGQLEYVSGWQSACGILEERLLADDLEENSLVGTWTGISIGSHVWRVIFGYYPDIDDQIKEYIVSGISVYENETIGDNMILLRDIDDDSDISFSLDSWNISIFDTFEKAEKCLKSEEKRRKYE